MCDINSKRPDVNTFLGALYLVPFLLVVTVGCRRLTSVGHFRIIFPSSGRIPLEQFVPVGERKWLCLLSSTEPRHYDSLHIHTDTLSQLADRENPKLTPTFQHDIKLRRPGLPQHACYEFDWTVASQKGQYHKMFIPFKTNYFIKQSLCSRITKSTTDLAI